MRPYVGVIIYVAHKKPNFHVAYQISKQTPSLVGSFLQSNFCASN